MSDTKQAQSQKEDPQVVGERMMNEISTRIAELGVKIDQSYRVMNKERRELNAAQAECLVMLQKSKRVSKEAKERNQEVVDSLLLKAKSATDSLCTTQGNLIDDLMDMLQEKNKLLNLISTARMEFESKKQRSDQETKQEPKQETKQETKQDAVKPQLLPVVEEQVDSFDNDSGVDVTLEEEHDDTTEKLKNANLSEEQLALVKSIMSRT
jgi:hypothetical protein